jgi:thioredoxin-related protein
VRVPPFLEYVRANRLDPDSVLAVMISATAEPVSYQQDVAQVARIAVQPAGGELDAAFKVRGYPTFFLLDGAGSVTVAGHEPAELPALDASAAGHR